MKTDDRPEGEQWQMPDDIAMWVAGVAAINNLPVIGIIEDYNTKLRNAGLLLTPGERDNPLCDEIDRLKAENERLRGYLTGLRDVMDNSGNFESTVVAIDAALGADHE